MKRILLTILLVVTPLIPSIAFARTYHAPPAKIAAIVNKIAPRYGVDPSLAKAIMWCESHHVVNAKHYNTNGTYDVGLFQINDVHIPALVRLGLTRYDPSDNVTYAMMLLRQNGTRDFKASASCWSPLT